MVPIPLVSPGFQGLNKQADAAVLDPSWATEALNAVFDSNGRLAARKGFSPLTAPAITGTPRIEQIFEYRTSDGDTEIIVAGDDNKVYKTTDTPDDITGTATITAGGNWQFVNFNDKLIGFQHGEQPIIYTGTSFADITATGGTAPKGNCGMSFAGRLWGISEDGQVLQASALLDETEWNTSNGAAEFDFTSVWPNGVDICTAIKVYNGRIIVFGTNTILFLTDGQGSALGVDPDQLYVEDWIGSIGCIARDSVQEVEGQDLLFLSAAGIQSLSKLIQERANPIENITKNVRDYFLEAVIAEDMDYVRSVYSPENGFYLISFPTSNKTFCFDTDGKLQDGSLRVTDWHFPATAMCRTEDGDLLLGHTGSPGIVGVYNGYLDASDTYTFTYHSPWLDLGEDFAAYLKIIKNISAIVFTGANTSLLFKWAIDFEDTFRTSVAAIEAGSGTLSEWGEMEWGEGEWSGGAIALNKINTQAYGTGQYYRIGLQLEVPNAAFSAQQINLFTKLGRLAQ